jgi:predicted acetyltransferase
MGFLTEPIAEYKDSFLEGVQEFQREGRMLNYDIQHIKNDFPNFLRQNQALQDPAKLSAPDLVPSSNFWFIDDDEYIGNLSIRHFLNATLLRIGGHIGYQVRPTKRQRGYGKESLRLGLVKARDLGITRVLITCDENNIASKKIIEYNGGQLENSIDVAGTSVRKLRYWIELL